MTLNGNEIIRVTGTVSGGPIPAASQFDTTTGAVAALAAGGSGNYAYAPFINNVALLGDSITNNNNNNTDIHGVDNKNIGYFTWFNFLSNHPFYCPVGNNGTAATGNNFGVGGNTTAQCLARVPQVLAVNPTWCFVLIGTNDLTDVTISYSTIISNLSQIYQQLGAAGIRVVALTIIPRSAWSSLTAPQIAARRLVQMAVNTWIRKYNVNVAFPGSNMYPIIVCDPTLYMVDVTSSVGNPLLGMLDTDGLHPNPTGAYWMGYALTQTMASYIPIGTVWDYQDPADLYDVTNNPTGNLLANGMMLGSGGTIVTGVTGVVADSWSSQRSGGTNITAVCSKLGTAIDGTAGSAQRVVASTTGAGVAEEFIYIHQDISTNFQAGDVVEASCQIAVSSISVNLVGVDLNLRVTGQATSYNYHDLEKFDNTRPSVTVNHAGVLLTQRLTIPVGATAVVGRVEIDMDATQTGSVTVDIGRFVMRKI